jgi:hypothetical protein
MTVAEVDNMRNRHLGGPVAERPERQVAGMRLGAHGTRQTSAVDQLKVGKFADRGAHKAQVDPLGNRHGNPDRISGRGPAFEQQNQKGALNAPCQCSPPIAQQL